MVDLFVAGDLFLGGDQPLETWRKLQDVGARLLQGPSDFALSQVDPRTLKATNAAEASKVERFAATQKALGELVQKRLSQLPRQLRVPMIDGRELLVVHGSPKDAFEPMSHDMSDDELAALLDDDPADIVLCGGTHVPFMQVIGEVQLINVGSVGESPEGRIAHFTVVKPRMDGAEIEQSWTEY